MPIFEKLSPEEVVGLDQRWRRRGRAQQPIWEELMAREPRLGHLLTVLSAVKDPGGRSFCANAIWAGSAGFPGFKRHLTALVGWGAEQDDPLLRSEAAYEVAYSRLYGALPPCRHCGCG
jgi:hypothetical protein